MTKTHWRLAKRLAVYGSYLLLTVVVSSPFVSIRNLGARSVSGGDVGRDLWCMSWVNHALKHHPLDLFQAHIFHPHKNALAFSEHFVGGAVLVFPWFLFSENPVYPFNFLFLVSYFLSAVTAYLLAFHYTRNAGASWLAGLIYGFCFFRSHHFTHLTLIFNPWIPLVVLAYEKLKLGFRWRTWFALLILSVLQCLTNWYTAFFVVLILSWLVAVDLVAKRLSRKTLRALAGFCLCAAVLIGPFYLPYARHHDVADALDELRYNSANLGSYLQPPFNTVLGQRLKTERRWIWGERSTYVGYTVLIPAALGMYFLLRRKWDRGTSQRFVTYVSLGLFAFLVSLGPYFLDLGGMVSPSRLLYWIIPPLVSLRAIARLAIVVMFCLAVLTALVVAQFRHRTNLMVIPLLGSLFLFEHFPVGLPWNPGEAHPFQARPVDLWLKEHASEQDALLELPGYSEQDWTREALYMVYSTQHWLRLVNGLARFYPPGYIEDQKIFATFPADEALELLKRHGVDYVIVHANQVPGEQLAALKNHPELKPAAVFGEDLLFRIQD